MVQTIQIKRGTRAQIEAAKAAGQLRDGEPYLITDENRVAVGTSSNGYSSFVKTTDVSTVTQGGTGATQFTGYIKGVGQDAFTSVSGIPATDITGPLDCGTFG
jgi:hypothetical protein